MNPRGRNRLVIETGEVVVLRKRLNAAAHAGERGFKRFLREVQPSQPQVIGVAKLGRSERRQEWNASRNSASSLRWAVASTSGTSRLWQT